MKENSEVIGAPAYAVKTLRELEAEIGERVKEIGQLQGAAAAIRELYTIPENALAEQPVTSLPDRKKKGTEMAKALGEVRRGVESWLIGPKEQPLPDRSPAPAKKRRNAKTFNIQHSTPNVEGKQPAAPAAKAVPGLNKPGSLGGAMKLLIQNWTGSFTRDQLRAAINADADYRKFQEEAGASTFASNLGYWVKNGKLKENEDGSLTNVSIEYKG